MQAFKTIPKAALLAVAILFGAATTVYSLVWMFHVHHVIGFGTDVRWLPSHEAEVGVVQSWVFGMERGASFG